MDTRHLIDSIVRQTTVLIAQLSTAAGIRAPLARVADQVFLDLTQELECQGVRRKVVADMFGMALRSYEKKVHRLTQSADSREKSLWEAVLEYVQSQERTNRKAILERFQRDDPRDVAAVLKDLTSTGFIWLTGRGEKALYQPASDKDFKEMKLQDQFEAVVNLVWLSIYEHRRVSRNDVIDNSPFGREETERAIDVLIGDGRVTRFEESGSETLSCSKLVIPVGAEKGWEAAVFDHFNAVTTAIAAKLRINATQALPDDVIGGSTLTFSVYRGHPFEKKVYGLLKQIRQELNRLWNDVSEYNETHAVDRTSKADVTFYFGQNVITHQDDSTTDQGDER